MGNKHACIETVPKLTLRVVQPIKKVSCGDFDDLYTEVRGILEQSAAAGIAWSILVRRMIMSAAGGDAYETTLG